MRLLFVGDVVGKPGRNIPADRANEHIFGLTIINDVLDSKQPLTRSEERWTATPITGACWNARISTLC